MTDRRTFIKKAALAAASAVAVPQIGKAAGTGITSVTDETDRRRPMRVTAKESTLIVPKDNGLRITGTFLDEISHDIPHQNWGEKEWDADFANMKAIGIDTVIVIRSGYRKFITYPSPYLLKKGCYILKVDKVVRKVSIR